MANKERTKVGKFLKSIKDTGLSVGSFIGTKLAPEVVNVALGNKNPLEALSSLIKGDKSITDTQKKQYIQELKSEQLKQIIDLHTAENIEITKRWEADVASKQWLPANIRPLVCAFLVLAFVVGWLLKYDVTEINSLLKVVLGTYFGSRLLEKTKLLNK